MLVCCNTKRSIVYSKKDIIDEVESHHFPIPAGIEALQKYVLSFLEAQMQISLSIDETHWSGWNGGSSTTTNRTVTLTENDNLLLPNWMTYRDYVFQCI